MMDLWDYKRFLNNRLLVFSLACSVLLVGEYFVRAERLPYARIALIITSKINRAYAVLLKQIDRIQIPEKSEDKLVQQNSGSYCGDFDFPAQH